MTIRGQKFPPTEGTPRDVMRMARTLAWMEVAYRRSEGQDDDTIRREFIAGLRQAVEDWDCGELGDERIMAEYQRAIEQALALDPEILRRQHGPDDDEDDE
jgi:hypothetical protein